MQKEEGITMEEQKKQQLEALELGSEYIAKLIPAMKEIIPELRGAEMPDTEDYLNQQLDGLNYVIDIINITIPYLFARIGGSEDSMDEKQERYTASILLP